jgi:hypothetical protein
MGVESLGAAAVCGVARARANCDAGAGDDIQPSSDFVRKIIQNYGQTNPRYDGATPTDPRAVYTLSLFSS